MNIGTKPILRKHLTVKRFSEAIMEATSNQGRIEEAKLVGQK